ncbi:MAG: VCBS repeat-containing protein [Nitrospirota bacterium]
MGLVPYQAEIKRFVLILGTVLVVGCASEEGSQSTLTIRSSSFPEIQAMLSAVSASLEVGGRTCLLAVDSDQTLDGRCTDIPLGTHSYSLKYLRPDLGVVIGTVEGSVALEQGRSTQITLPPIVKTQDDDQDGYSNLVEVMFGTDAKRAVSRPSIPAFGAVATYTVGPQPSDVGLGEFNNDGALDVVTTNWASDSVSVLLGSPEGTLNAALHVTVEPTAAGPRHPNGLAIGDLNGDSNADLLVVNSGADSDFIGDLAVLLGRGDGTFQEASFYSVGDQPVSIALGDLNEDGVQDVVTADFASGDVAVLLGNGNGTLQPAVAYSTGAVGAVGLADVDKDGHLDVVTALFDAQSLGILLGNGDGTFQPVASQLVGIMSSLALGDFNGDLNVDVAASIISSQTIIILLGNGDGTFQAPAFYPASRNAGRIILKDLDKDGRLDLVTPGEDGVVAILLGAGNGTFRSPGFFSMGTTLSSVVLGDMNDDGDLDLVSTDETSGTAAVLLSTPPAP